MVARVIGDGEDREVAQAGCTTGADGEGGTDGAVEELTEVVKTEVRRAAETAARNDGEQHQPALCMFFSRAR